MRGSSSLFPIKNNFTRYANVKSNLIQGVINKNVTYTFFIPTFRRSSTLRETLNSVLVQSSLYSIEIIVVDNNPERNDETEKLLKEYVNVSNVIYYKNSENIGMVGNWNRGYELANGEWVIMIHDDDLLCNQYLSAIQNVLGAGVDGLFCKRYEFQNVDGIIQPELNSSIKISRCLLLDSYDGNHFNIAGNVLRKRRVLELGGFDENYYPSSDYEFYVKYSMLNRLYKTDEKLVFYRIGLNESLKISTLEGFIVKGELLRIKVTQALGLSEKVSVYAQQYISIKKCLFFKKKWNENFVYPKYDDIRLGKLFICMVCYLYLKVWVKIKKVNL